MTGASHDTDTDTDTGTHNRRHARTHTHTRTHIPSKEHPPKTKDSKLYSDLPELDPGMGALHKAPGQQGILERGLGPG